jgi:hypothetical protein
MLIVCSAQGTCDHSNGPSDSINGGQVLHLLMGNVIQGSLQGYSEIIVYFIPKFHYKVIPRASKEGPISTWIVLAGNFMFLNY